MSITIVTLGGVDPTLGGRVVTTADWNTLRGRSPDRSNASVERGRRGARFTGSTYPVRQITITHKIVAPAADLESTLSAIEGTWYAPHEPAPGAAEVDLVFRDHDGIEKVVRVVPVALAEHPDNSGPTGQENWWYQGTWDVLDHVHYAVAEDETETAGAAPTVSVPVRGTVASRRVVYEITPGAQKDGADGQRWRHLVTVANRSLRPLVRFPVLLTPGGIDHAALVTATESLSLGHDVEGYAASRRIPVWSDNWNAGTTLVWGALDLPSGRSWTVKTDAASGASEVEILEPIVMPPGETWYVMSEATNVWRVTAFDAEAGTFTVEDAARDTTAEALQAGDILWWVAPQGLVDLVWGWTGAPAPGYDARLEPIIDLASSTNDDHVYSEYYEPISAGNIAARHPRPGSLVPRAMGAYDREFYSGDGDQYWRYVPSDAGEPGAYVGLDYRAEGAVAGRPLFDRWDLESPVGMTEIAFTWTAYVKYGASGGGAIKRSRLAVILVDADGNEIIGGRYDTTVTGGTGSVTLSPAVPVYVASFRIEPYDRKLAPSDGAALEPSDGAAWKVEALEVAFSADENPLVVCPLTVHDIYQFGRPDEPATIATSTGTLSIAGVIVDMGDTLVVDVDARSIALEDGSTAFGHLARGAYPEIPADLDSYPSAGSVDVDWTEDGEVGLSIVVRHRDAWV